MIIVKYGDLKKKQKKTRWKAACYDCGCNIENSFNKTNSLYFKCSHERTWDESDEEEEE